MVSGRLFYVRRLFWFWKVWRTVCIILMVSRRQGEGMLLKVFLGSRELLTGVVFCSNSFCFGALLRCSQRFVFIVSRRLVEFITVTFCLNSLGTLKLRVIVQYISFFSIIWKVQKSSLVIWRMFLMWSVCFTKVLSSSWILTVFWSVRKVSRSMMQVFIECRSSSFIRSLQFQLYFLFSRLSLCICISYISSSFTQFFSMSCFMRTKVGRKRSTLFMMFMSLGQQWAVDIMRKVFSGVVVRSQMTFLSMFAGRGKRTDQGVGAEVAVGVLSFLDVSVQNRNRI